MNLCLENLINVWDIGGPLQRTGNVDFLEFPKGDDTHEACDTGPVEL